MNATIALAGCGKMGAAMLRGWLSSDVAKQIHTFDPNGIPQEFCSNKKITHHESGINFSKCLSLVDILVIAVKPQEIKNLINSIRGETSFDLAILSIAAGQTIQTIQNHFASKQPVIRAMPNLPASIGKGITVACAAPSVSVDQKKCADDLLKSLGMVEWIEDETLIDAVTALSGSGPAYIFYLIECMAHAGEKAGLPADLAMKLARQTVIGSATLCAHEKDLPAKTLRENVTSPNGTTAAALSVLMNGQFDNLITEAILNATARSKELSA